MASSLPTLLLERCAQTMEKVIIPNITDDFASMQAGLIAALLHILAPAVEEKGKELLEENDGIREVLERVRDTLCQEKHLSSSIGRNDLFGRLDHELQQKGVNENRDISEENQRLRGALVEVIKGLDALRGGLPEETLSSLRQDIRLAIREELDRAVARVASFDMKKIVERK